MMRIELGDVVATVEEGVRYLRKNRKIKIVYLVGVSMGAALAWRVLEQASGIDAAIVFYGVPSFAHLE